MSPTAQSGRPDVRVTVIGQESHELTVTFPSCLNASPSMGARLRQNYDSSRTAAQPFASMPQWFRVRLLDLRCPLPWPSRPLERNRDSPRGHKTIERRTKPVAVLLPRVVASTRRRDHSHLQVRSPLSAFPHGPAARSRGRRRKHYALAGCARPEEDPSRKGMAGNLSTCGDPTSSGRANVLWHYASAKSVASHNDEAPWPAAAGSQTRWA